LLIGNVRVGEDMVAVQVFFELCRELGYVLGNISSHSQNTIGGAQNRVNPYRIVRLQILLYIFITQ